MPREGWPVVDATYTQDGKIENGKVCYTMQIYTPFSSESE